MKFRLVVVFILFVIVLQSQSSFVLRGDQTYHSYDRLEILKVLDYNIPNGINNYKRHEIISFLRRSDTNKLSKKDLFDIQHIAADNFEFLDSSENQLNKNDLLNALNNNTVQVGQELFLKSSYESQNPVFNYFYKSRANFLQFESDGFSLFVNPVAHFNYINEPNNPNLVFQNTRGIDVRAYIDKKVYIHTHLLENQRSYLSFIDQRIQETGALPGQGFSKGYQSGVIDRLKGYDFFHTRAYFGFNASKSINLEMGHGNHFIGNGIRSLLLSDYSHNYFYLSADWKFWKFHYKNIFAELNATTQRFVTGDNVIPKKYKATHYLSFKPTNFFEIGIFESVIFARQNGFELQYLNPVVLYRAVEHYLGSPDNVIVGTNVKFNPIKGVSLYGQLVLDEFKISEVRKQSGWWANKFGIQAGIKYINALNVDHLDLQLEYNSVRPYTYTHRDTLLGLGNYSVANYSNHNQPLAHLLGANFKEMLFSIRYKPTNKIYVHLRGLTTLYGADEPLKNWGGNILLTYNNRPNDFGNIIGQGKKTKVNSINLDVSYEVFHNYFIDMQGMIRSTNQSNINTSQNYLGLSLRVNIANTQYDY